ncbi:MAG: hypothetical protein HFE97_12380 [Oscillospiraceae bacterium]|nr:hypothetical protein [Oscillospiraceae bacterium]
MTKTEYTAAITASQTTISAIRTDLRKLHTIEKLSQSFPGLELVDTSILETAITERKAEVQKLRSELSKARRIVKRMAEIEDIETGKADTPKAKKSAAGKKAGTKPAPSKKSTVKPEENKAEQPTPSAAAKENPAA